MVNIETSVIDVPLPAEYEENILITPLVHKNIGWPKHCLTHVIHRDVSGKL